MIGYVAVASIHGTFEPASAGLDNSWAWAVNHLPSTEYRFGTDVVFTYGPLGYLLAPLDIGANLILAAGLWVIAQVIFACVAIYHFRRTGALAGTGLFALLMLAASAFGLLIEYRLLISMSLLLTVDPRDGLAARGASIAAGVLAAILLYTKFTSGSAAVAMLAVAAVGWAVRRKEARAVVVLWFIGPFVAAALVLGAIVIGGPSAMARWIAGSYEIARGFAAAMSVPEPGILVVFGFISLAGFVVAGYLKWREERRVPVALLPVAIVVLAAVRHGYVRHHGRFVFPVIFLGIGVIALLATTRRGLVTAGVAALAALTGATSVTAVPECLCEWKTDVLLPIRGPSILASLVTLGETRDRLAMESQERLAPDRLPSEWVQRIRASGGATDVLPEELAFIPANRLRWRPNPVLQTYHAYTPSLDQQVAGHFAEGPEWLLVEFADVDERHPMFAAPEMWQAIMTWYEPSGLPPHQGEHRPVLLLRRRTTPSTIRTRLVGRSEVGIGEWVEVPAPADQLLFGSIRLHQTFAGSLAEALWRIDPVFIEVRLDDGTQKRHRIIPATSGEGILLSPLPQSPGGFLRLMEKRRGPAVSALRVVGPGTSSFDEEVLMEWRQASWG